MKRPRLRQSSFPMGEGYQPEADQEEDKPCPKILNIYRITVPGRPGAVYVPAYAIVSAVRSFFHGRRQNRPVPSKLEPGQEITRPGTSRPPWPP